MARNPFSFFRRKPRKSETRINENWDLKGQTLLDIIAENNGGTVTQKTAMKFTGVLAAVSLRSELLASFPKMIYEKVDSGRQEVYGDPLYKILAYQPNPYMNAFTFWELVNTHLDLWGNAYVYISRYGGQVRQLTPIDPDKGRDKDRRWCSEVRCQRHRGQGAGRFALNGQVLALQRHFIRRH
jgi:phage portal protein BeeE